MPFFPGRVRRRLRRLVNKVLPDDECTVPHGPNTIILTLPAGDAEGETALLGGCLASAEPGGPPSADPVRRPRPATCLADVTELRPAASRFDHEMPAADPGRALLRKWWEWDYLADCAEQLDLIGPERVGVGLGVGVESIMYYFARHCRQVIATDLYSSDTSWREARFGDFREAVQKRSPFHLPDGRLLVENADMRHLPVAAASQDFAWSTSSIEHVPTLTSLIEVYAELARVLKPGGCALLTTEFCLSQPPYLLPHLNATDPATLKAFFSAFSPWFEPLGPLDLTLDQVDPGNGCGSRRYLKAGMVAALHDPRFDRLKIGHVVNPVGISAICPIGFTLRRTNARLGAMPTLADLRLTEAVSLYTEGLDLYHKGENLPGAERLLATAADRALSVQFRLHAFRFGIDAELRAGLSTAAAGPRILSFLAELPAVASDDADCGDLFSHVLRDAGAPAEGAALARAGALSPSTTWDHALRLAARSEALAESADALLAGVARDLVLGGAVPGAVFEQCRAAGAAEGLSATFVAHAIERAREEIKQRVVHFLGS